MNLAFKCFFSPHSILLLIITSDPANGKGSGKSQCGKFCQENPAAYYGILGGSAVAVTIIFLACWYMCYRYKKSRGQSAPAPVQDPPRIVIDGGVETVNGVPPVVG